jgi:hypothetical protein
VVFRVMTPCSVVGGYLWYLTFSGHWHCLYYGLLPLSSSYIPFIEFILSLLCFFFCFLIYLVYMRKCCDCEKHRSRDFDGCTRFEPPQYEEVVFGILSVCLCGWMCASPAHERLGGLYSYSIFKNLSVIGWCSVNMNVLAPEIRARKIDPEE